MLQTRKGSGQRSHLAVVAEDGRQRTIDQHLRRDASSDRACAEQRVTRSAPSSSEHRQRAVVEVRGQAPVGDAQFPTFTNSKVTRIDEVAAP